MEKITLIPIPLELDLALKPVEEMLVKYMTELCTKNRSKGISISLRLSSETDYNTHPFTETGKLEWYASSYETGALYPRGKTLPEVLVKMAEVNKLDKAEAELREARRVVAEKTKEIKRLKR